MRYVYVEQFGYVWRLSMSEWTDLCRRQCDFDAPSYDLDDYRLLRRRPRWLVGAENGGYWIMRSDVNFVQPLDWTAEDFAEELEQLPNGKPHDR